MTGSALSLNAAPHRSAADVNRISRFSETTPGSRNGAKPDKPRLRDYHQKRKQFTKPAPNRP
ncbi:MAG: hypothetical protein C4575_09560 [Desulforudis sp.]|nr:MAG: hypothetical protein C4575_09560 [Desulforudis sp.]